MPADPARTPNPMFATLLSSLTDSRRAGAIALLWLLIVTILNVQTSGSFRATILFAIPVAIVSWKSWRQGLLVAAVAVLAARFGDAIPEPGSTAPLWLDAMLAFIKLSIDAAVVNAWGRKRMQARQMVKEVGGAPPREHR